MSELNRSAIYNLYEAYRRKDMPAIFELLDPDVEVYQTQLPLGAEGIGGMPKSTASLPSLSNTSIRG